MAKYISYIALLLVAICSTLIAAANTDVLFCQNVRAPDSWEWELYPCMIVTGVEVGKCYIYPSDHGRKGQSWKVSNIPLNMSKIASNESASAS